MYKYLIILILIDFLSADIFIDNDFKKNDNFSLGYYYDELQEMNITSIQKAQFNAINNKFTFGYIYGDSWFKLTINNQSDKKNFILYFTEAFHKNINLFEYRENIWIKEKSGISEYIKYGDKKDINPTFMINIKPKTSKILYIQIHSEYNARITTYGEFIFYTHETFLFNHINDTIIYYVYYGTMLIIIILNIFIFIIFREIIFIYYILYIVFNSIFILSYSGIDIYLGLAEWHKYLNLSIPLFAVFFSLFSMSFLNIKTYLPIINKILIIIFIITLFLILFIIIDYDRWFDVVTKVGTIFLPLLLYS